MNTSTNANMNIAQIQVQRQIQRKRKGAEQIEGERTGKRLNTNMYIRQIQI